MEIKQQLKLSQQLVMTPQLQQAIKLLQMSRMELLDVVQEEMLENPVLEDVADPNENQSEFATEARETKDNSHLEIEENNSLEKIPEPAAERTSSEQDIDWERYLENHAMQAPMPAVHRGESDDVPNLESTLTRGEDLVDHLTWQLRMTDFIEEERSFAMLVFGNLNDDGYLKVDGVDPEAIVPKLAAEADLYAEDAEEVLKIIQRFDPIGVAARTLSECLLIQAEHLGLDELVVRVIQEHLHNLEKKNFQAIAKELQIAMEEVLDIAQIIGELEPRPGRYYTLEEPQYIVPDVHVHKVGDKYFVVSNDDGLPKLRISNFYRSALQSDGKAKEYVQSKLRSAQWLIRSIDQRRKTIVRVTECIVEKQREFFENGVEFLKPMILRDVADAVGMHESTVSRVTSNKYVHTPRGLFELKYFFNSAIKRDNNDAIASESVKQAIKKIIGDEDHSNPLSDQKIVELLASEGVVIARRTVAKYREMLGVLSSSRRKKYF